LPARMNDNRVHTDAFYDHNKQHSITRQHSNSMTTHTNTHTDIGTWQNRIDYKVLFSFPEPQGPRDGADLRFLSPQPDTSRSRKTTDTGLVHRMVCPFTPQLEGWHAELA